MAAGRRACPWRRLRRRSTSWSSSVSDYTTRTRALNRLKQIEWRSCIGNGNLLKPGGPAARPLRRLGAIPCRFEEREREDTSRREAASAAEEDRGALSEQEALWLQV